MDNKDEETPAPDPHDGGSMRGEKMAFIPSRSPTSSRAQQFSTQVRAMKRRKRDLDEAVPRPPAELIDELAIHIADGRNVLFITGAGLSVSA